MSIELLEAHSSNPASQFMPLIQYNLCYCIYSNTKLTGNLRTRCPWRRFSESYAVQIIMKISRICEFCAIMVIITCLLGCCSSSILASRANDYSKTLPMVRFWLHHSPCSLGTNNTLSAGHYPLIQPYPGQPYKNPVKLLPLLWVHGMPSES